MGRLTGKYSKANPPPAGRGFSNVNMEELEPLLETMRRIANNRNVSVSSIALNYVICKGNVLFIHNKRPYLWIPRSIFMGLLYAICLKKKVVSIVWD
jgi:hypothetical protein